MFLIKILTKLCACMRVLLYPRSVIQKCLFCCPDQRLMCLSASFAYIQAAYIEVSLYFHNNVGDCVHIQALPCLSLFSVNIFLHLNAFLSLMLVDVIADHSSGIMEGKSTRIHIVILFINRKDAICQMRTWWNIWLNGKSKYFLPLFNAQCSHMIETFDSIHFKTGNHNCLPLVIPNGLRNMFINLCQTIQSHGIRF